MHPLLDVFRGCDVKYRIYKNPAFVHYPWRLSANGPKWSFPTWEEALAHMIYLEAQR